MLEEESKAIQEIAKTVGKATNVLQNLGGFMGDIFGDSFRQFGGALADGARFYRYKNFLRIIDKIAQIHKARIIEGKPIPIPPQYTLPLFEGASLESEESLQNLWAGLIANASDPRRKLNLKKVYIEILRGLEPLDAKILELLSVPEIEIRYSEPDGACLNTEEIARLLSTNPEEIKISLQTLARYACILDSWGGRTWKEIDRDYSGFRVNNPKSNFRLSHLGRQLVEATRST